tara:strand:+ start:1672 stop:2508 length:837 start_codon:yes stop_codon:yes gene_type:complete
MKLWLIGITTEGHQQDLKELIEPIKSHFDGLIWTFHYPKDEGADYLESVKGEGEIIYTKWCNRLDFSRNHSLFQGPIQIGDWFVTLDTLERLSPTFSKNLKSLAKQFDQQGIEGSFIFNKRFMFKMKEQTCFANNPHEGIAGARAGATVEFTRTDFWKDEFLKNIRSEKRQDEFYFVGHNFKYYLFPNTNHLVLHHEHDAELIKKRYQIRAEFMQEVKRLGFNPYSRQEVEKCLREGLTDKLKKCVNEEKFLNDWYRYEVLGFKDIVDKHDFSFLKKV